MKLTTEKLKKIIREEVSKVMSEETQDKKNERISLNKLLVAAYEKKKKAYNVLQKEQEDFDEASSQVVRNMPGYQGRGYDHYAEFSLHLSQTSLDAAKKVYDAAEIAFEELKTKLQNLKSVAPRAGE